MSKQESYEPFKLSDTLFEVFAFDHDRYLLLAMRLYDLIERVDNIAIDQ
jgi:hypothetical protein